MIATLWRGHNAYDLDTPEWSQWIEADLSDELTPAKGKDWVWREDRVRALLSQPMDGTLLISGCAENMNRLFPFIDTIILLSAPLATIMERSRQGLPTTTAMPRRQGGRLPISSQPSSRC
jgi:hypothetical protein